MPLKITSKIKYFIKQTDLNKPTKYFLRPTHKLHRLNPRPVIPPVAEDHR